ncbi:MAG: hypothetical protein HY899_14275, partial [Deltaproteobacteria bacterium]|nr:hypothetical protein [Deltaproteobacteria bacterium]
MLNTRFPALFLAAALSIAAVAVPSDHAEAQNIGSGPLLVGGYTGDQDASGNDDALAFG